MVRLDHAASASESADPRPRLTWKFGLTRLAILATVYAAGVLLWPVVGRFVTEVIASTADVLLWRPGFGARAHFEAGGAGDLLARLEHEPSGLVASNRIDVRFRLWVPAALLVALVIATPAPAGRRVRAIALGGLGFAGLALVLAWLAAVFPGASSAENVFQLGTAWRVAVRTVYTVLVLSNPAVALIPVVIWGMLMKRELGELLTAAPLAEAGSTPANRR